MASERVILPPYAEPTSYDLDIVPDLVNFTYTGVAKISVNIVSATAELQLHSKDLYVSKATFEGSDGKTAEAVEINVHLKQTILTLKFPSELVVGAGTLTMQYRGEINNAMAGFYRSQYEDATGAKKWMGSTQFEALDARRAFPCWDEPARKATFTLALTIPKEFEALSNMPESSSVIQKDGATRKVTFIPSPKMSTYLLCWCVGEFDAVTALTSNGVLCKVYTPPGRGATGKFALDVAVRTLELYDDFFRVPYPLPKLDMIAIMDFAMGAMENWGLVTYREVDLLIDDAKASNSQKQRVASVVAHELAHQWFGNLVTMEWWDDLWLNEGFASWTQTLALDALFPDWGMWTQFICDDQSTAMRLDAMRTSHPIQVPIKHAEEVEEVFDMISYCKGASVVRILHAVLGAEAFQAGLQIYMERHQYGNTVTTDLWKAWEEASGKPIAKIMNSWTTQMGFPLVEVVGRSAKADGSTTLQLTQKWFLADGSSPDDRLWTIPLTVTTSQSKDCGAPVLFTERSFSVDVPAGAAWAKLNGMQHVPLRVAYDAEGLAALAAAVAAGQLGAEDRVGLLMDALALAKAGHASMSCAALLKLLAAYKDEAHASVWQALESVLNALHKLLLAAGDAAPAGLLGKFEAFAAKLVIPAAAKIGWEPKADDGHLGVLLRASLVRLQAKFCATDPAVRAQATKMWDAYFEPSGGAGAAYDASAIPADFKIPVFKIMLAGSSGEEESARLHAVLMAHLGSLTANAERKHVYLALGANASPAIKRQVLEWAVGGELKMQDFFYPIGSVSQSSPEGLNLAWSFYQEKFDFLKDWLSKASPSLMDAAVVYSVAGFATAEKADEIEAFFTTTSPDDPSVTQPKLPQSNRKILQTVEGIRTSAAFLTRLLADDLSSVL